MQWEEIQIWNKNKSWVVSTGSQKAMHLFWFMSAVTKSIFLLNSRNLIYSIFKPNKNADLYQNCTSLKLFLFWKKKRWPHQLCGALRKCWNWGWFGSLHWWWLSLLCTWCPSSLQREWGGGRKCFMHFHELHDSVLRKFYHKKHQWKIKRKELLVWKQKQQLVWMQHYLWGLP